MDGKEGRGNAEAEDEREGAEEGERGEGEGEGEGERGEGVEEEGEEEGEKTEKPENGASVERMVRRRSLPPEVLMKDFRGTRADAEADADPSIWTSLRNKRESEGKEREKKDYLRFSPHPHSHFHSNPPRLLPFEERFLEMVTLWMDSIKPHVTTTILYLMEAVTPYHFVSKLSKIPTPMAVWMSDASEEVSEHRERWMERE